MPRNFLIYGVFLVGGTPYLLDLRSRTTLATTLLVSVTLTRHEIILVVPSGKLVPHWPAWLMTDMPFGRHIYRAFWVSGLLDL